MLRCAECFVVKRGFRSTDALTSNTLMMVKIRDKRHTHKAHTNRVRQRLLTESVEAENDDRGGCALSIVSMFGLVL